MSRLFRTNVGNLQLSVNQTENVTKERIGNCLDQSNFGEAIFSASESSGQDPQDEPAAFANMLGNENEIIEGTNIEILASAILEVLDDADDNTLLLELVIEDSGITESDITTRPNVVNEEIRDIFQEYLERADIAEEDEGSNVEPLVLLDNVSTQLNFVMVKEPTKAFENLSNIISKNMLLNLIDSTIDWINLNIDFIEEPFPNYFTTFVDCLNNPNLEFNKREAREISDKHCATVPHEDSLDALKKFSNKINIHDVNSKSRNDLCKEIVDFFRSD